MARLHHIGIACRSVEQASAVWGLALGVLVGPVVEVPEEQVRIAFLPAGQAKVELLEPTGPESPIARFLDKRGEGMHHVAFAVDDLEAAMDELRGSGARLLDEAPRRRGGNRSILFVHPKSLNGVLTELVQYDDATAEQDGL